MQGDGRQRERWDVEVIKGKEIRRRFKGDSKKIRRRREVRKKGGSEGGHPPNLMKA